MDNLSAKGPLGPELLSDKVVRPAKKSKIFASAEDKELEDEEEVSNYTLLVTMQRMEKLHIESLKRLQRLEESTIKNASTIQELMHSMEFQSKQLKDVTDKMNIGQVKIKKLEKENADLKEKCLQLETYQRRWNLRVAGVPERGVEDTKKLVVDLFSQVSPSIAAHLPLTLDIAHRLGPRSGEANANRRIIVRFLSRAHRDQVWRDARTSELLRERKITVSEDLTQQTKDERNKLWPLVEKARKEGKRAGFRGAAAFIEGKK
ncbi:hypothetical protein WMY93_006339 [Mugilogobius chulae]|uniref:L1 transposable element RRM domain-containing protein n=1 Tax=Mugilogobius chulae TaxID=88201 RepID=A0AAW0PTS7_9GOBI